MNFRASPEVTVDANSGQVQLANSSNVQSSGVYVLPSNTIRVPTAAYKRPMKTSDKPGLPTGTLISARLVFNRLYGEQMTWKVSSREEYPVYPEMANSAKDLIRSFLYQRMGLTRGKRTSTSVKIGYADMLSQLKRRIEDKFRVLRAAQNSWIATEFIKEAMQRDKKAKVEAAKKSARKVSGSSVARDNVNRTTSASSVCRSDCAPRASNGSGGVEVGSGEPHFLQQVKENEMGVQDCNREQHEVVCAHDTSAREAGGDRNRNFRKKKVHRGRPALSEESHSEEGELDGSERSELANSTVVQSRNLPHLKAAKRTSPEYSKEYQTSEFEDAEQEVRSRKKARLAGNRRGRKRNRGRNQASRSKKVVDHDADLLDESDSDSIRPVPQKCHKTSKVARDGEMSKSSGFRPPRPQPSRRKQASVTTRV